MSTKKRILYLDPFSGIAGDMFVGMLLDLGLDFELLKTELNKLKLKDVALTSNHVMRGVIAGTKFDVLVAGEKPEQQSATHSHTHEHGHEHSHHDHAASHDHEAKENNNANAAGKNHSHDHAHGHSHSHHGADHAHHHFSDIRKLIKGSELSPWVKEHSLKAFTILAKAEGHIHGMETDNVAFHEAGAVDSIIDLVGACIGLEAMEIDEVHCGAVAIGGDPAGKGSGYIDCAHGKLPVPAFATLEVLKGIPLRSCPVNKELTTPTGATIVKTFAQSYGPMPTITVERIGYGAGTRNDPEIPIPNLLRGVLGELTQPSAAHFTSTDYEQDQIVELQTNLDDATGEEIGYLSERLFEAGALDVFWTAIQMKKNRPGVLITVLAPEADQSAMTKLLLHESPAFGVRYQVKPRFKLTREIKTVETPWGKVRVKLGRCQNKVVHVHPEFEDCKKIASAENIALREVIEAARSAASE